VYFYFKVFFFSIVIGLGGCLESSFQLSEESRLPKWFSVPNGMDRNVLSVQMDLHSTFSGGKAVFKLYKKGDLLNIKKYTVTTDEQPNIRSVQLNSQSSGYPRYKVVTINGITDVVELRKMEPVFYMTDDPAVWKALGVKQETVN
jgi:hypothetical protein